MPNLILNRICRCSLILLVWLSLAGCATSRKSQLPEIPPKHTIAEFTSVDQRFAYVYDPWVEFNRGMYRFNYYFDKYVFLPVVHGYEFVTPVVVQHGVSNFYNNLGEIRTFYNELLQLKGMDSVKTLGRFVTNSTVGIGGLFDPATQWGLKRRHEDFGLTLGHWGVESGPYLVLPIFGPSSGRDAGGLAIDTGITYGIYSAIDPFGNSDNSFAISTGITLLNAVDTRHQQTFRYYESGYPFEYYIVRFLYHEKRELEITKPVPKDYSKDKPVVGE